MDDIYTVTTSAFPTTARLVTFRGVEAISKPYRFELTINVPVDDAKSLDFMQAVGATASFAMHGDRKDAFVFQGILTSVELVHAHSTFALFRAVLEPRLSLLGHSHHSRLFTEQSVPDIIKAVLEGNGLTPSDYALQLTGSYPVEEHVCQYLETDLDFLSRWMEHLGIYYFFEHDDEKEKLVITDDKSSQSDWPTDPVRYFPANIGDRSAAPGMESFRCVARALPASVKLKSYDYMKPTLDVSASAPVASNGKGEISIYGARFFTPGDAAAFAKLRADELLARQLKHTGSSTVPLRAGFDFTLEEHPLDAMNGKYLAVEVEHFGNLVGASADLAKRIEIPYPDVYRCEVKAIPDKVQFRPERTTPWPRIHGLEHGLIDGEANHDYAQIDDQGRYRVKFFFDESDLKDGKASTWVRMAQPHGGSPEGFHFPLRKGTEVMIAFLGGDPDRPVITGAVNTATTPSPIASGNSTRNVLQTGGLNRLEIEDAAGGQKISLSTPTANTFLKMGAPEGGHELTVSTDANAHHHTAVNHDHTVGGIFTRSVKGAVIETHEADQTTSVFGLHDKTVGEQKLHSKGDNRTQTDGFHGEEHKAGSSLDVKGGYKHLVNGGWTGEIDTMIQKVTGAVDWAFGPVKWKRETHSTRTFGRSDDVFVGTKTSLSLAATADAFVGIKAAANLSDSTDLTVGISRSVFVGGKAAANLALTLTLNAAVDITYTAGFKGTFGSATELNVAPCNVVKGKTMVLIDAPNVNFTTDLLVGKAGLLRFG